VIEGHTSLGIENTIFQFASVGAAPQDLKYRGEASKLTLGDRNIVREYVTLQPGTAGGGMVTSIGSRNLFMACAHVGHDCHLGDGNVFANSVGLSGHVTIGSCVVVGGLSGIHQFVRVGDFAMLGGGSMAVNDVPPYSMVAGDRAALMGINKLGLERAGFSPEQIQRVRRLFRKLFFSKGLMKEKIARAREEFADESFVDTILCFVESSERGVILPRRVTSSVVPEDE